MWNLLLVVCLLVFGVILLLAELFLLPGFGIAGIFGILSLVAAVVCAYTTLGTIYPHAGIITLCAAFVLSAIAIVCFFSGKGLEKMALDTTIDSKVDLASPGRKMDTLKKDSDSEQK